MAFDGRVLMSLVMLAIFVGMVAVAFGYPPEARLLPLVIGIPGTVLCLAQLGRDLAGAGRKPDDLSSPGQEPAHSEIEALVWATEGGTPGDRAIRREAVLFGFLVALIAGILVLGFWLAAPLFLIAFLRFHERESWRFTLALSAGGWLVLYLIFDRALGILLHRGFLIEAVLG